MSIASVLQRKIISARLVSFAFFGLFVLGLFLPKSKLSQPISWIAFLGVAGSHLYISARVVCPKCKAKLGQARFGLGLLPAHAQRCPGCGLDFNGVAPYKDGVGRPPE